MKRIYWGMALIVAITSANAAEPLGMVDEPCEAPPEATAELRDLLIEIFVKPGELRASDIERLEQHPDLVALNEARRRTAAGDWAGICRYAAANASALAMNPAPRIVFLGDSITENWVLADPMFFENGIVGRGIGGQTTPQMLVRFRADVVALHPQTVHILAGTNDVAGNTGPSSPQDFKNNIMSMVEIAAANGIEVILGSIPPAASFYWRPELDPTERIAELNVWLRDYARRRGLGFVDYHSALTGPSGELRAELGNDGVHPNLAGYTVMRRLFEDELARIRAR
jgi:lysophospholipase L1-like esterase